MVCVLQRVTRKGCDAWLLLTYAHWDLSEPRFTYHGIAGECANIG
jgi:hypothetical protein